jgi:hypothetical protein
MIITTSTPPHHLRELRRLYTMLQRIPDLTARARVFYEITMEKVRRSKPDELVQLKSWLGDPRNSLTTAQRAMRFLTDFERSIEAHA